MMSYIILGSDYNKINLNAGEIQITMVLFSYKISEKS